MTLLERIRELRALIRESKGPWECGGYVVHGPLISVAPETVEILERMVKKLERFAEQVQQGKRPEHLTLGQLIEILKKEDPSVVVRNGFHYPHSYRGYYDELAFEPCGKITIDEMLSAARSALGGVFNGYKGEEYTMFEHTPVWLANRGETGESLGRVLLQYILSDREEP